MQRFMALAHFILRRQLTDRWQRPLLTFCVTSLFCAAPALADPIPTTAPATQPDEDPAPFIYIAPLADGAPHDVIGGASKGFSDLPIPQLCAPGDHMGLTSCAQPTLYFYVAQAVPNGVSITLNDPQNNETISLLPIGGIKEKGLQRFDVAATGHSLKPGIVYTWSVAIHAGDGNPDHDAYGDARIRYDQATPDLTAALAGKTPLQKAAIFAEHHFWFDTIAAEMESIDANPAEDSLREQLRRTLGDGKCPVKIDSIPTAGK